MSGAGGEIDIALFTLARAYEQTYDNFDGTFNLYESSGLARGGVYWDATLIISFPDIPVIHITYTRAALTCGDHATAKKHTSLTHEGFALMDVDSYRNGFCKPSNEWIWGVYDGAFETIWCYR